MFNIREEYRRVFTARAELMRLPNYNTALLKAYDALIDELSNDVGFRVDMMMQRND